MELEKILKDGFIKYEEELSKVFDEYDIETAKRIAIKEVMGKLVHKIEMYYRQLKIFKDSK